MAESSRGERFYGKKGDAKGKEEAKPETIHDRHARERDEMHGRHKSERDDMHKRHEKDHADMAQRHADEMMADATNPAANAGPTAQAAPAPATPAPAAETTTA